MKWEVKNCVYKQYHIYRRENGTFALGLFEIRAHRQQANKNELYIIIYHTYFGEKKHFS